MARRTTARRRVHLLFVGRVQGVGFRYTAAELARSCGIGGFVRNLPDGTVELAAEGEVLSLDRFLLSLQHCRLARYIVEQHQREESPSGESDFSILV
jgi:acylphosphatase